MTLRTVMGKNREREIENTIIAQPELLGFRGAAAIRNVRVAWKFGRVDVMLLPRKGPTKIVLVEAKHASAPDAICKVLGQLLMYYAGALTIGSTGLACYRRYARDHRADAVSTKWISPKALTGGISPPHAAWSHIRSGTRLEPKGIALFVALNERPHKALEDAARLLARNHNLRIGLAVVNNGRVEVFDLNAAGVV